VPCTDADTELNVGDCAYDETDFTYSITITIGSVSTVSTIHVGEKLKLTKVQNLGDARDFNNPADNFIVVSTVNIPDCTMSTNKAISIVGGTGSNIILNTNVNDGD